MIRDKKPKYSIIIPVRNGIKYLPNCINTIIQQDYEDYELIISNDHSTDGTKRYLETLSEYNNIKIIEPTQSLSMTEHWEWALSHAIGEWQIFVGQDDGLQKYFFELADKLTVIADENNLRTIMSSRAYYFWSGCEYVYGDLAIKYRAIKKIQILNIKFEGLKALLGFQDYFELPQMYTTSLFHKSLLDEAKLKQDNKVFTCHPQDANLAAIAVNLESNYLKSFIPLGWVGTSPKSAGMAILSDKNNVKESEYESVIKLKKEYEEKVNMSRLTYHSFAGDFAMGSLIIYFWQALLKTSALRSCTWDKFLVSKFSKFLLLSFAYNEVHKMKKKDKLLMFYEMSKSNKINTQSIKFLALLLKPITYIYYAQKLMRKIIRPYIYKNYILSISQNNDEVDMIKVSDDIKLKFKSLQLLDYLK